MATDNHYDTPPESITDGDEPKEQVDLDPSDPQHAEADGSPWLTDEEAVERLNIRWRKVIEYLMDGDMIYEAYAKAYDINIEIPSQYNVAKANGSRLLTNANFQKLWDKVLAEHGLNNQAVDMELLDLIKNPGIDPKVRLAAIKHHNELRGRVTQRVDHTSKGQPLPLLGGSTPMVDEDDADGPAGHDSASEDQAA